MTYGDTQQGLKAHIRRWRNSPVMHPNVPDLFKPVMFKKGSRVPFPRPTMYVHAPKEFGQVPRR